jgi:hypothetical protein
VLEPHAASTIARAWAPGVAKVQFSRAWGMEFDPEEARRRSVWYLQCQMAAAKLSPPSEAPISPMRVLGRAMRAVPRLPASAKQRGIMMAWLTAVALTPRGVAKDLIAMRFIVGHRPRWLERIARARS